MGTTRTATMAQPKIAPRLDRRGKGIQAAPLVLLEAGLCALIVVAPLPFGSVGPAGRLVLELLALTLTTLWMLIALKYEVALPPRAVSVALIGLLALATIQLLPVGAWAVSVLSPHAAALRNGLDPVPGPTLSLAAGATASALRTGAALVGIVFVTTSVVAARGATRIALTALLAATFQGLCGLLVYASGTNRLWSLPNPASTENATGTFVNRNHFAAFLAATLPLGLGLVFRVARRAQARSRAGNGLVAALGTEGSRALLLGLAALTGTAGLLLSFSRAGTAIGLVAMAGTAVVLLRGKPVHRFAVIAIVVAIAALPLADLGADHLAARYAASGTDLTAAGGRLRVAVDTLRMIAAFPAFGCGFGTFTWVFPAFSSPEVRLHYTFAHNDLLQLGAEGGLPALGLLVLALAALSKPAFRGLRGTSDPLATGAAFGLGALLFHGLVDFNFHIPGNAAIAAVLSGVLLGVSWNGRS